MLLLWKTVWHFLQKLTFCLVILSLSIYPREMKHYVHKSLYTDVRNSIIRNSQRVKKTQVSIRINKMWYIHTKDSQVAQWLRTCLPIQEMQETWVRPFGWGDPLEEEMTTHSSILA